ncbi:hypothetical protein [Falsiroseomonas oryzae]|uniref:hypothetical protein n=1 Tax=Falsiroseomonas oryzae TaxID=2766473 RepID=UPI0022EAA00D|nr:hypothetical protein [Roseomonas sp. MO-31]
MPRALLLLLVLLVGGCAERWVRPGTTEAEADATNAVCQDRSELAVPPQMVWQMVEPAGYDRDRRCWRQRDGREVCETFSRWRPARYAWVDVASGPRDAWRRECMRAKGFTFQGYRPLRLE